MFLHLKHLGRFTCILEPSSPGGASAGQLCLAQCLHFSLVLVLFVGSGGVAAW